MALVHVLCEPDHASFLEGPGQWQEDSLAKKKKKKSVKGICDIDGK